MAVAVGTGSPATPARRGGWLVSPAFDLAWFSGPALVTAGLALLLPGGLTTGFWSWLGLVVLVDVAHTWATLYRAWLDPVTRAERPGLLWGVPVLACTGAMLVHSLARPWFWTVLAYVAVYHFIRQQQGFAALYRARAGVPRASWEARVEDALVGGLCLWPVLWWHTHLPREFAWFTEDDFLVGLPPWVLWPTGVVLAGLALAWLTLRVTGRRPGLGRDLWVGSTAATWFGGIVLTDGDLSFTLANVVAHGVPYFALVHHTSRRQWEDGSGPVTRAWFQPAMLGAFLLLPVGAALVEELAWDALVWREHFFPRGGLPDGVVAVVTPLLVVPQLTHYLLDGYLWKVRGASRVGRWVLG